MAEHTPGPWAVVDGKSNGEWRNFSIRPAASMRRAQPPIATVSKSDSGIANARLIAGAPDLLEAARAALDDLISDGHAHYRVAETLRAAIDKATGDSRA